MTALVDDDLAGRFERTRPRLTGVAQRMLGSAAEAEDAVQEAWIRLQRSDTDRLNNLDGWLTTVVARVCLDMLRSRRARREDLYGDQLPDPVVTLPDGTDPLDDALLADAVSGALLVVLEHLNPSERLVFVLHDMFAVPFEEIGAIVGRSPNAAKQLASRARRRVQGAEAERRAADAELRAVVEAFLAASRGGDLQGLVALLDPDVVLRADTGPLFGGVKVLHGADAVAEQASGFRHLAPGAVLATVDGAPGILAVRDGMPVSVLSFDVRDGLIVRLEIFADTARLAGLGLPAPDLA